MIIDVLKKEKCTGCSACVNCCTKDALTMREDEEGFEYPWCDTQKCNNCNLCEIACPVYNDKFTKLEVQEAYAVWSLDKEIRRTSTSGGAFTEIAQYVLSVGGVVAGAAYNEKSEVYHCLVENINDLEKLRQSKYCQSKKNDIFRTIKKKLDDDKYVMFVGAPCEVAGLKKFLVKQYENLIVCDFICKGNASLKVYRAYLNYLEKTYGGAVTKVWFKEKKYGWNNFSTKVFFDNGKSYRKDRYHDLYMRGYVENNLFLRKSCDSCIFKGEHRFSDLTLADFWGVGSIERKLDIDKGTSLVIVNSLKGKKIIDKISDNIFIRRVNFSEAVKRNTAYTNSIKHNPKREEYLHKIDSSNFFQLTDLYIRENKFRECKRNIRNYLHWIVRKMRILVVYIFDK